MGKRKVRFKGGYGKQFAYTPCRTCGKWISNCGFAYTKHEEMHRRNKDKKRKSEMKHLRVKVRENCIGDLWDVGIFDGKRKIIATECGYFQKGKAIRRAKAIAKRIGIPYDPEIIKQHDC